MSTQYHIYANGGSGPINYGSPIATVTGTSWSSSALAANSSWKFGVRAFDSVSTLEEKNVDAAVSILIGPSQQDLTQLPPMPLLLTAVPLASGGIRVTWVTSKLAAGYHVYAGVGSVSYSSPAATVAGGKATLTGYSDGDSVVIGVRAFNAVGEESNTKTVTAVAMATGPAAVVGLSGAATAVSGDGRS